MSTTPPDDGLSVVFESGADEDLDNPTDPEDGDVADDGPADGDLETLRDEFVDGFNARDLDVLLALVRSDVEIPDLAGDGATVLAEELEAIWERNPGAILTRAFLDGAPAAVAWLPDEDGCWSRAALVCFASEDGLLSLVMMPEDADGLDRAEAEDPTGEELDEWSDWTEWEQGEETVPRSRTRQRP